MKIHILGSGAYPLRFQNGRSLSIFFPEQQLIIDGGFGIIGLPDEYRAEKITILLTHYHHDHILGLAFLANVLEQGITKRIDILGDERIEKLGAFFKEPFNPDYTPEQYPITMGFIPEKSSIGTTHIARKQVPHSSGFSNMYRIEADGKVAVIITDTTAKDEYAPFIEEADVLFHECNYDNKNAKRAIFEGHSYPDAIISLAKKARVKKLVLIHTDPRYPHAGNEVIAGFPGTSVATDDQIITL